MAQLSDGQIEVLRLVSQGFDNELIAQALGFTRDSVCKRVSRIRRKLGLPDRLAMVALDSEKIETYRRPVEENKSLTKKQQEVAYLIAKGLLDEDIAKKLRITHRTLEGHVRNICNRLGLGNRVQIAYWVVEQGWVTVQGQPKEQKKEPSKPAYKSLFAALALSPSNKAIMAITKKHRLIIERHWTPSNLCYCVHLIDMAKRDIAYATGTITGLSGLEEWVGRISKSIGVGIDIHKKRWLTLEESERSKE